MDKSVLHKSPKITASEGFTIVWKFKNNGCIEIHEDVNVDKNDFRDLMNISIEFAKAGRIVQILPHLHYKDRRYKEIFGSLIGSKYEGKCPDLKVDEKFYEYEGFITHNPKTNLSNMLGRGLKQSSRVIVENCGVTERYILNNILARVNEGQKIEEVWLKVGKVLLLIYEKTEAKQ